MVNVWSVVKVGKCLVSEWVNVWSMIKVGKCLVMFDCDKGILVNVWSVIKVGKCLVCDKGW